MKITSLLVTVLLIFISAQANPKRYRIVIDAGHGGIDSGATATTSNFGTLSESRIVLLVAEKLRNELRKDDRFDVLMTRHKDETVSLESRSKFANQSHADLFVSIHVNSNPSSHAHGTEFYILGQMADDEEAMFLAHQENQALQNQAANEDDHTGEESEESQPRQSDLSTILQDLVRNTNTMTSLQIAEAIGGQWKEIFGTKVKIRQAPFHVLAFVNTPSILMELGFLTNAIEGQWLSLESNQDQMARVIETGIKKFFEKSDKEPGARHISAHAQ